MELAGKYNFSGDCPVKDKAADGNECSCDEAPEIEEKGQNQEQDAHELSA